MGPGLVEGNSDKTQADSISSGVNGSDHKSPQPAVHPFFLGASKVKATAVKKGSLNSGQRKKGSEEKTKDDDSDTGKNASLKRKRKKRDDTTETLQTADKAPGPKSKNPPKAPGPAKKRGRPSKKTKDKETDDVLEVIDVGKTWKKTPSAANTATPDSPVVLHTSPPVSPSMAETAVDALPAASPDPTFAVEASVLGSTEGPVATGSVSTERAAAGEPGVAEGVVSMESTGADGDAAAGTPSRRSLRLSTRTKTAKSEKRAGSGGGGSLDGDSEDSFVAASEEGESSDDDVKLLETNEFFLNTEQKRRKREIVRKRQMEECARRNAEADAALRSAATELHPFLKERVVLVSSNPRKIDGETNKWQFVSNVAMLPGAFAHVPAPLGDNVTCPDLPLLPSRKVETGTNIGFACSSRFLPFSTRAVTSAYTLPSPHSQPRLTYLDDHTKGSVNQPVESPSLAILPAMETIIRENFEEFTRDEVTSRFETLLQALRENTASDRTNATWTDRYGPRLASQFCGNTRAVEAVATWLASWKQRSKKRKEFMRKRRQSSFLDDFEDEDMLCNAMVITGPPGCGKSAAIKACASQFEYSVLEINPSTKRSGAAFMAVFGEATLSHALTFAGADSTKTSTPSSTLTGVTGLSGHSLEKSGVKPSTPQASHSQPQAGLRQKRSTRPRKQQTAAAHDNDSSTEESAVDSGDDDFVPSKKRKKSRKVSARSSKKREGTEVISGGSPSKKAKTSRSSSNASAPDGGLKGQKTLAGMFGLSTKAKPAAKAGAACDNGTNGANDTEGAGPSRGEPAGKKGRKGKKVGAAEAAGRKRASTAVQEVSSKASPESPLRRSSRRKSAPPTATQGLASHFPTLGKSPSEKAAPCPHPIEVDSDTKQSLALGKPSAEKATLGKSPSEKAAPCPLPIEVDSDTPVVDRDEDEDGPGPLCGSPVEGEDRRDRGEDPHSDVEVVETVRAGSLPYPERALNDGNGEEEETRKRIRKADELTLIVLEEIDVLFDDERGFLSAVETILNRTKRPILITKNDPLPYIEGVEAHTLHTAFDKPARHHLSLYLQLVSLAEGVYVPRTDMLAFTDYYQCDIRRCLHQLQFLIQRHTARASPGGFDIIDMTSSPCSNPLSATKPAVVIDVTTPRCARAMNLSDAKPPSTTPHSVNTLDSSQDGLPEVATLNSTPATNAATVTGASASTGVDSQSGVPNGASSPPPSSAAAPEPEGRLSKGKQKRGAGSTKRVEDAEEREVREKERARVREAASREATAAAASKARHAEVIVQCVFERALGLGTLERMFGCALASLTPGFLPAPCGTPFKQGALEKACRATGLGSQVTRPRQRWLRERRPTSLDQECASLRVYLHVESRQCTPLHLVHHNYPRVLRSYVSQVLCRGAAAGEPANERSVSCVWGGYLDEWRARRPSDSKAELGSTPTRAVASRNAPRDEVFDDEKAGSDASKHAPTPPPRKRRRRSRIIEEGDESDDRSSPVNHCPAAEAEMCVGVCAGSTCDEGCRAAGGSENQVKQPSIHGNGFQESSLVKNVGGMKVDSCPPASTEDASSVQPPMSAARSSQESCCSHAKPTDSDVHGVNCISSEETNGELSQEDPIAAQQATASPSSHQTALATLVDGDGDATSGDVANADHTNSALSCGGIVDENKFIDENKMVDDETRPASAAATANGTAGPNSPTADDGSCHAGALHDVSAEQATGTAGTCAEGDAGALEAARRPSRLKARRLKKKARLDALISGSAPEPIDSDDDDDDDDDPAAAGQSTYFASGMSAKPRPSLVENALTQAAALGRSYRGPAHGQLARGVLASMAALSARLSDADLLSCVCDCDLAFPLRRQYTPGSGLSDELAECDVGLHGDCGIWMSRSGLHQCMNKLSALQPSVESHSNARAHDSPSTAIPDNEDVCVLRAKDAKENTVRVGTVEGLKAETAAGRGGAEVEFSQPSTQDVADGAIAGEAALDAVGEVDTVDELVHTVAVEDRCCQETLAERQVALFSVTERASVAAQWGARQAIAVEYAPAVCLIASLEAQRFSSGASRRFTHYLERVRSLGSDEISTLNSFVERLDLSFALR